MSDDIFGAFPFTNWMLAATVGGIKPGCYKIGNTGGMMDNVIASKLYRRGSVGYVSKSGGMSNELNNIICNNTDGVYEGVAIGGDRYPGVCFRAERSNLFLMLIGSDNLHRPYSPIPG